MKTEDFNYDLPDELIAQTPIEKRDTSKLLILDKNTGEIKHEVFKNITNYLTSSDVLVLNDTKVLPARLKGIKEETNANIEVLLLKEIKKDIWQSLVKPAKRVNVGTIINFKNILKAECVGVKEDGIREFKLIYNENLYDILDKLGTMPLPPYIHEKLNDQSRYQTIYAKNVGSAAAPTAGLHFTEELISEIKKKGVKVCYITLHVGLGTFRPVNVENIKEHKMHSEYYEMNEEVASILNETKKNGGRIISVGTTSTRTLESIMSLYGNFKACSGTTEAIDALITNFHLPKSTLLMLVSALAGKDNIMSAYNEAVLRKYRFFSFGDAMFIK